ncbi:helix-turn-helix domain-containing protein [Brevibacillus sp. NRS-1366]|uniref:helix-turn-helix domain-containing protein n=1 Tax=Brevibacillus sp. NRS-1366 TaxID=3233899 RepID=UPI003D1BC208
MFQLSLREARLNCRLELDEVSARLGIPVRTLKRWEIDCGKAEVYTIVRLIGLYGISSNHVYFGSEVALFARRKAASESHQDTPLSHTKEQEGSTWVM